MSHSTIDVKAAAAALEQFADELDAKGITPTADELAKMKNLTQHLKDARAAERADAVSFLAQLGGSGASSGLKGISDRQKWAGDVATRITKSVGEFGVKALSTGGIDVPQVTESIPVSMPVEPTRVLDLLVSRKPLEGNTFNFLRQTARDNLAATVADNALKPTSVYTFEEIEDRARVFAHLSEAFPQRYLDDHEEIRRILASQMAEDVQNVIEEQALVGDGVGENFTGLSITSGVRTGAYTTDLITTLRKARTTMLAAGESPNAWVFNHTDLEALDLIREDGATGGFMDGLADKVLGNLPAVGTSQIPAGFAYLGDWSQTRLYVRDGGRLDADMSGELFDQNQVKLRYEGRFGWAVLRPAAFIKIDLTV